MGASYTAATVGEIVLLWIASSGEGLDVVEARAASSDLRVLRCAVRDLHIHTLASGAPSPVIAVVDDDRAATEALGAGVDEVVRQGELTAEGLDRAVIRAQARAHARTRPSVGDDSDALASILDWIAIEMVACVSGAVLEGELLEESVRRLVAERVARGERSEAIPSASDTLEMLDTVRESFRRMQAVLQAVRSLSGYDEGAVAIGPVLTGLARVLLNRSVPVGNITIDADPRCATSLKTPKLVSALVLLMGRVFDRAERAHRPGEKRIRIVLRAFVAEDAAIVEIEDDIGDFAREASAGSGWRTDPIAEVRTRLREEGADVLLSASSGRTTVRLVLPLADCPPPLTHEDWMRDDAASRPN